MPAKLGVPSRGDRPRSHGVLNGSADGREPATQAERLRAPPLFYSASSQNWTSQHEGHSFYGCCPIGGNGGLFTQRLITWLMMVSVVWGVACCPWAIIPSSKASNPISAASIA